MAGDPRTVRTALIGPPLRPGFAPGSPLAFHPHGQGATVMGDLAFRNTGLRR